MTSTYSSSLRLELMATGDQSGTWGDTTNTNLGTLLEQAITGYLSVAQGDVANLTLTTVNGGSDQARNAVVNVTGALTANRNVVVQTANKLYLVKNATTGGYSIVVKTAAGTGVTIVNGASRWVYSDGTNVVDGQFGPLLPSSNDGGALGSASVSWSDLFLASGAVINIANGDWVATHTTGILTVGTGDLRVTTAGTNTASVVTVGGTQTLTNKTMTSPVLNTPTVGTSLLPTTDDGAPLGSTTKEWSDLFLASGGVINWANGDVTATHSSNALAFAGASSGYSFDAVIIASAGLKSQPRVKSEASNATPSTDADSYDLHCVTAAAANMTIGSPTGTPANGQKLMYRFKDNGSARTIAWNAVFRAVGVSLPATTVISKTLYVGAQYNSADSKWDVIAVALEA